MINALDDDTDDTADLHLRSRECLMSQGRIVASGYACCKTCWRVFYDQKVRNSVVQQAYLIMKAQVLRLYAR